MRLFEVVNGSESYFFGWEEDAKKFAKEKTDGVPFIDKHFVERPDEFAALLNKVAHAPKGVATGASRQTHISANGDSTTDGY
jgi:hypothetical protein